MCASLLHVVMHLSGDRISLKLTLLKFVQCNKASLWRVGGGGGLVSLLKWLCKEDNADEYIICCTFCQKYVRFVDLIVVSKESGCYKNQIINKLLLYWTHFCSLYLLSCAIRLELLVWSYWTTDRCLMRLNKGQGPWTCFVGGSDPKTYPIV